MFGKFRYNFITGIVVLLPAAITLWLLVILYRAISNWVLNPIMKIFEPYLINIYLEYTVKIALFLILVILVALIGLATRVLFIRRLFSTGERIFFKVPMLGKVYITIRQISKAIFGEHKSIFKAPVLVEYPRKGVYSIGFLTSENKGEIQKKTGKKLVNVFIPTVPNPTTGALLLIPEEEVITLDMSIEEAMKLIISGGIITSSGLTENQVESRE